MTNYEERINRLSRINAGGPCRRIRFSPDDFIRKLFSVPLLFLNGSLTVECAFVMPVFLVCMAAVLQFANVYNCAVRLGSAMTQTAEEMAIAAYATEYMEEGAADSILGIALSTAYASGRSAALAGDTSAVKRLQFLLSSFLEESDRINIVASYQVRSPVGIVRIPGTFFVQKASVRGWTGREGSGGSGGKEEEHQHQTVYVAENGVVYHTDSNCSHIRLTIMPVTEKQIPQMRNLYGEKYHKCEKCGSHPSSQYYITTDGNRYHTSLECGGLKRTVREMDLHEVGELRPCSRCAGGGKH